MYYNVQYFRRRRDEKEIDLKDIKLCYTLYMHNKT